MKKVCVFGASSNNIDPVYIEQTEYLGRMMADSEMTLVYGGWTSGLMGAVARGVRENDGYIIGVSPKLFNTAGVLYPDFNELFLTDDLTERKQLMLKMSDCFVVVPGGIGTFDELFEVYAQSQLGYYHKPLVLYNINGYYDLLWEFILKSRDEGFCTDKSISLCHLANSAREVVDILNIWTY